MPGGRSDARWGRLPPIALVALGVGLLVLFLAYPTYPNYDTIYSQLWARELVHGVTPTFDAFRAPTEHPLAILFSIVLVPFGEGTDRFVVFCAMASVAALAAGLYRLGSQTFNRWTGLVAGVLLVANWDLLLLAVRGYLDVTYMALVVWGAALEATRARRGVPVLVLLTLAALLRPEAWVLAGLYALRMAWGPTWRDWRDVLSARGVRWLAAGIVGPVIWVATDYAVTGQPFFSLQHTSGVAEELERTRGILQLPGATLSFFKALDGLPLFFGGVAGLVVSFVLLPKRLGMAVILLVAGVGTFAAIGVAGLSVIDRYLLVPAAVLLVFAAFLVTGWSMLPAGRLRWWWSRVAILAGVGVVAMGVLRLHPGSIDSDLEFRGDSRADLARILDDPAVQRARRCGPVWTPNHKLVPDSRWLLDAGATEVLPRSALRSPDLDTNDSTDRVAARRASTGGVPNSGVLIIPTSRQSLLRQAVVLQGFDDPRDALPLPGFRRIATSTQYAAYARC